METGNLNQDRENKIIVVKRRLIQKNQSQETGKLVLLPQMAVCFVTLASLCSVVTSSFFLSFDRWLVYPVLFLFSVLFTLYYDREISRRLRLYVFGGAFFAGMLLILLTKQWLLKSFYYTANAVILQVNSTYEGTIELFPNFGGKSTYLLVFMFFWIDWFLAKGMIGQQDKYHFLFVVFPIVVCSFLGGRSPSSMALFLLFLCFLSITASSGIRVRKKFWGDKDKNEFTKNQNVSRKIQFRIEMICAVSGTILVLLAFYVISPGLSIPLEKLSDAAFPVKSESLQFLYQFLPKISGGKLNLSLEGVGGGVSDGALGEAKGFSYDNQEALRITSSVKIQETLYLKGFIGAEYAGNRWKEGDRENFENAAENWELAEDSLIYIQNIPFLRMMYALENMKMDETENIGSPNQLTVERLNANRAYTYVPYQAFLNDYYEVIGGDGGIAGQTAQDDIYAWYSVKDYQKVMLQWKKNEEAHGVLDYAAMVYEEYAVAEDTKVTQEGLERVEELCKEKKEEWDNKESDEMTKEQIEILKQEKYEDIKKFIIRTLWENCTFVPEAWKLPKGENFVDYFLFEEKRGDSTAFASTAAVMFRMCGIPARYVVGYAAPPNLFYPNGDGSFSAVLQEDNAHAWVEIYMPDIGWTPVETTPGFDGTVQNMEISEEELEEEQAEQKEEEKEQKEQKKENPLFSKGAALFTEKWFLSIAVLAAAIFFMVLRYRHLHKKRRGNIDKWDSETKIKVIFYSFYEVLLFDGFPQEIDTTEPEFAEEVSRKYPSLSELELGKYMELVLCIHYGYKKPDEKDVQFAVSIYEKLVKEAVRHMKKRKKVLFYFWKAF